MSGPAAMAFRMALQSEDARAACALLLAALRSRNEAIVAVEDLVVQQQRGEAFSGGRSTPVHEISADVRFRNGKTKRRFFVAKVVEHGGASEREEFRRASYLNERAFYSSGAADVVVDPTLPRLFLAEGDDNTTCLVMADLRTRYPRHPEVLSDPQTLAALQSLARFHAAFYANSKAARSASQRLFKRGTFWRYDAPGEAARNVARSWPAALRWLESRGEASSGPRKWLATRPARAAPAIHARLCEAKLSHGTLLHGDWKAANLFFGVDASVAAVDFQFAGGGVGAQDVAYFLFPDFRRDIVGEREQELLDAYFDAFSEALAARVDAGSYKSYSRELFGKHYELARLDFFRHMLGKGWVPTTDADARAIGALEATLSAIDRVEERDGAKVLERLNYEELLAAWLHL